MEKTAWQWMTEPLRKYGRFSGRARRAEFWWFYLFTNLVGLAASGIDAILAQDNWASNGPIGTVVSLGFLIPTLAVGARRLHDTGRSGWWMATPLLGLVPVIGAVVNTSVGQGSLGVSPTTAFLVAGAVIGTGLFVLLLVWFCTKGEDGPNSFGDDPFEQQDFADVFG